MVLQRAQNKDRMIRFFAKSGIVPCLEELLSMGADPSSMISYQVSVRGGGRWRWRDARRHGCETTLHVLNLCEREGA